MSQTKNPWMVVSLYDLQYFNCPECTFKNYSKQTFVNHAYEIHPESIESLNNIQDNSMKDIVCPWMIKEEVKNDDIFSVDYPLEDHDDYMEFDAKELDLDDNKSNVKHVISETKPNPTVVIDQFEPNHCAHCDIFFVSLGKLQSHLRKFHDENVSESDPDFEISEDLDNFDQDLTIKSKISCSNEEEKVPCPKCEKKFSRKFDLNRHILSIHERIRPFQCDLCPSNYMSITNLRIHYEGKHNKKLTKNSSEFRKVLQDKLLNEKKKNCSKFKGVFKLNEKVSDIEMNKTEALDDNVDSEFEVNDNYNDEKEDFLSETPHSSEIRGLRSTKCSSKTLQNLLYFMYKKTQVVFFLFHFVQLYIFTL